MQEGNSVPVHQIGLGEQREEGGIIRTWKFEGGTKWGWPRPLRGGCRLPGAGVSAGSHKTVSASV